MAILKWRTHKCLALKHCRQFLHQHAQTRATPHSDKLFSDTCMYRIGQDWAYSKYPNRIKHYCEDFYGRFMEFCEHCNHFWLKMKQTLKFFGHSWFRMISDICQWMVLIWFNFCGITTLLHFTWDFVWDNLTK